MTCRKVSKIRKLAISENTIILFVSPPQICICIVFGFYWNHRKSQEKLETMLMQNLGGQTKSILVVDSGTQCSEQTRR